ncbi:hypothetical protein BC827DRAFT_1194031 [Russula dissimulans]|nr:hypothetical protein BC827DRAFT_1194031 [Russula dissimulans]
MTRFSARTSSSQLDDESTISTIKGSSIDRRRANLNRKAEPRTPGRPSTGSSRNFVYVGNLRSDVLNADLEQLFKRSGKVTEVVVRCCNGVAVPTTAYKSSCYATVGFSTLEGATQALNMNGQDLLGQSIVVRSFASFAYGYHSLWHRSSCRSRLVSSGYLRPISAPVGVTVKYWESTLQNLGWLRIAIDRWFPFSLAHQGHREPRRGSMGYRGNTNFGGGLG